MLAAARRWRPGAIALSLLAGALFAAPAWSDPLGLGAGDLISDIEFDTLQTVAGDGTSFTVGSPGLFAGDGRITAVNLDGGGTTGPLGPSFPDLSFDLSLTSHNLFVNVGTGQAFLNVVIGGVVGGPDVVVNAGGVNILLGNLSTPIVAQGNFALTDTNPTFTAIGRVHFFAGNSALLAALGPLGAANVLFSALVFDGMPNILTLAADGNIFNSNFTVSTSGTFAPLNPASFVPEPSTALLLGGGLIALLGVSRRARRGR